jgi:hypothetical protein
LIPFLVICLAIDPGFKKYSLEIVDNEALPENNYFWYKDIDNDGISERIQAAQQDFTTAVIIFKNDIVVDQWNFEGTFDFWNKRCLFIAGDSNNDDIKELYVFTLRNDTILLHCIPDPRLPAISIKNRPIAKAGPGIKKADPFIVPAEMDDLDGDGVKELIFGIGSGFSEYPRAVFAYYISKDSLAKSPESSYFISAILQVDINRDGRREVIPYGISSGNVNPDEALYHDYSNFSMILDNNLNFLFKPFEFRGRYTTLSPKIFKNQKEGTSSLMWLRSGEKMRTALYYTNSSGNITDSLLLDYQIYDTGNQLIFSDKADLHMYMKSGLALVNKDFKLKKIVPGIKLRSAFFQDFDLDGKNEILVIESNVIHVYREGYKNEINVKTEIAPPGIDIVTLKTSKSDTPVISVQSGINFYHLRYGRNPAYLFLFLYYPLIYLGILAFALAVRNIQKHQSRKRYESEKRISELQLALIRNQLDPHFTFNAINSIIYSVEFRQNEDAADQLRQFSSMYRNMLTSAGSTQRTIAEEVEFCENYLRLEKLRFKERFDYQITISDEIDRNLLVPKFIIQIYAENAVKHGLSSVESGGKLTIELKKAEGAVKIEITDNGIGRNKSEGLKKNSTGRGLETMEELFTVYNKYYNEKVSSAIIDLYDEEENPAGTKIRITITKDNDQG